MSAVGHISKQEQPKLTSLGYHWFQLSIKSQNSVPSVRPLGCLLGAQLLVLKPALIQCCCAAWNQTAMRKALWENVGRSKNLTSLIFFQVQTLSLPMPCHRYDRVCLCIVLVPVLLLTQQPDFMLSSSNLFHCSGLFWLSSLLSDWIWGAQWLLLRVCEDCITWWGYCPSHLGAPLAHLLSESCPLFLLPDPGSCYKVLWCICCCLCECFAMQFIYKSTIPVLINKQR